MTTLDQIKELRSMTGVSTMACKKALDETNGDIQKALELLRKKGEAKSAERSDRSTCEGAVFVRQEGGKVAMVSLKCETDFVGRSDDFLKYGEELAQAEFDGHFDQASGRITDFSSKVGEKIEIGEHIVLEGSVVASYVHTNKKIGTVVVLDKGTQEMARDVALHVAAMNPKFLKPEDIESSLLASEMDIWTEQLRQEGKPDAMIPQILKGKEKKFREEQALLTQPFVKDPEKTIQQYLSDAQIVRFVRFGI